jgi:pseudoazurin
MEHPMLKALILSTSLVTMTIGTGYAAEVEVRMLNKGASGVMVFEPSLVKIELGDTVKFVAADKCHNVESIDGMYPEGAKAVTGKLSEEVVVTFDTAGAYGFRCKPHYGMGMVALVVVGTPGNINQARSVAHPGKANTTFATLFEQATTKAASN